MKCRNYKDGEVVWFGSTGIKNQDTDYQEIDITNSNSVAGTTIENQRYKIKGFNDQEWKIRFYDQYGIMKYEISTKDLPLKEMPQLDYNANYTFSWDKTLSQVNAMTNGGNIKCRSVALTSDTILIPIDSGIISDTYSIRITNKITSANNITLTYPSANGSVVNTYTLSSQETKEIYFTIDNTYTDNIIISATGDFYLGDDSNLYTFYNNSKLDRYIKEIQLGEKAYLQMNALRSSRSVLEKIIIPEYSTSMGIRVFSDCANLKAINLPDSIVTMGYECFEGSGIVSIVYGDQITSMGDSLYGSALMGCEKLENVVIGNSVIAIGTSDFEGCISLKNITIPNSVEQIELFAFKNCTSLEEIYIPESVVAFGDGIFAGCSNLKKITIPYSNGYPLDIQDPSNAIKHFGTFFYDYESAESMEGFTRIDVGNYFFLIPDTLSDITITKGAYDGNISSNYKIETDQFKDMTMLRSIGLGENVQEIENDAFKDCTGLTFLVLENQSITIGSDAFSGCDNLLKGFYGDLAQADIVLYNGTDKVAYITLQGEYSGILTQPITSVAVYNHLYDHISISLYPYTQKNSADNFVDQQSAVASSLNQKLNVIKGELWYNINAGLPLFDKVASKVQMDASVLQIINSNEDVVGIKSFESYIQGHNYNCKVEIVSKYGDLTISF